MLARRYVVGRPLRRSPASDVFAGYDDHLTRPVAIEVFAAAGPGRGAQRARWRHQLQLLAGLDHPGLLTIHDLGRDDAGHEYAVTRLVEGLTLAERIRRGPQRPDRVLGLGAVLAGALAHMHAAGLVHRNLRPAVVRLESTGRPCIDDLTGAAFDDVDPITLDETGLDADGDEGDQRAYLAPEQLRGDPVGPEVDVHALGMILVRCLAARSPLLARPAADIDHDRGGRCEDLPASTPSAVRELLAAMTDPTPTARPTAAEAEPALAALAHEIRPTTTAPRDPEPRPPGTATPPEGSAPDTRGAGAPTAPTSDRGSGQHPGREVHPTQTRAAWRGRRATAAVLVVLAFLLGVAVGAAGVRSVDPTTIAPLPAAALERPATSHT